MKYHESQAQANEIMQKVMVFLNRHALAANPVNYAVAYEHVSGQNPTLSQVIEQRAQSGRAFDNFVMENLYADMVLKQSNLQQNIVEHLDKIVDDLDEKSSYSNAAIGRYLDKLDNGLVSLSGQDINKSRQAINGLIEATREVKKSQQNLQAQLLRSCSETEHLRMEIEDLQRERSVDALTGLKNAKAVDEYMSLWLKEYPQRKIAAIAIDIDHFRQVNETYGHMVGDVILGKVAKKISHYVSDSGLPLRVGGEEFLILLPDVDLHTAVEVAEQVRKGVEKMKFVSARSKRALPNLTVSLGTASYRDHELHDDFIARADSALLQAKSSGRNRVVSESAFN